MSKLITFSAVYAIISGFAMFVLWIIFYAIGFVSEEFCQRPVSFLMLLYAEFLTAIALLIGGFGIMAKWKWGRNLTFTALGMMLYAVVYGSGEFAQRGNMLLTGMFAVLSMVTFILLALNIFHKNG